MDSQQGVCLFFQRTGTCKAGDKCPLSHVGEQRGITTKYDDRIWHQAQVVCAVKGSVILECFYIATLLRTVSRMHILLDQGEYSRWLFPHRARVVCNLYAIRQYAVASQG